jgi:hypothetical protein
MPDRAPRKSVGEHFLNEWIQQMPGDGNVTFEGSTADEAIG